MIISHLSSTIVSCYQPWSSMSDLSVINLANSQVLWPDSDDVTSTGPDGRGGGSKLFVKVIGRRNYRPL